MARSLPVPTPHREAEGSGGPENTMGEALMVSSTASQMFVLFTVKYSSNLFSKSWQSCLSLLRIQVYATELIILLVRWDFSV